MKTLFVYILVALGVVAVGVALPQFFKVSYFYFAAQMILQYVILATAWNVLGGYTGYVNFGVAAFFALGAYTAAVFILFLKLHLVIALLAGGLVSGLLGFGIGYLTLRLRGVYFAIATLALSVVIQMIIVNSPYLGGAKGLYIIRPKPFPPFSSYSEYLFALVLLLSFLSVITARSIEKSWIGRCFASIKDSEEAAACLGVPVFRLKLFATTLSGFWMGVAGATFPYYITYLEPYSAMSLDVAVNTLAMSLVGGTGTWLGPVIGAVLLGIVHQVVTVAFSSDFNLLFSGIILIGFVILAPEGIIGWFRRSDKQRLSQ